MEFGIKDILYFVGLVVSIIATFLGTRYKLKEYVRDRHDSLKEELNSIRLQLKEQEHKDALQQQVIDQMSSFINSVLPKFEVQHRDSKQKKDG